jgi:hypothetical protein
MAWDNLDKARAELAAKEKEKEEKKARREAKNAEKEAMNFEKAVKKLLARMHEDGSAKRAQHWQMHPNRQTSHHDWASLRTLGNFRRHGSATSNESRPSRGWQLCICITIANLHYPSSNLF